MSRKTIDIKTATEYITIPFSPKGHEFKLAIMKGKIIPKGKQTTFNVLSDNVVKDSEWSTLLLTKETFKDLRRLFNEIIID